MKDYFKFKDFIPVSFVENKNYIKNKGNNNSFKILIIINIILAPVNYNILFQKEEVPNIKSYDYSNKVNVKEISEWIKLNNDNIEELKVENSIGNIIVNDGNTIEVLVKKGFTIKMYNEEEDNIKIKAIYEN